jgi:teichuronic acid biosynthesis glycosyltransferase TuaC
MPVGIDLATFANLPSKKEARQQLGLPVDERLILFVGNLFKSKGVQELLDAYSILREDNAKLVMVGEGPLRSLADSISGTITVGRQSNNVIPHYMAAADVLVLPSYSEGMPTVIVEAGAAGLPVVATDVGGIPELLDGDRGLLIKVRSSQEIAAAVKCVFFYPENAERRSTKLKQHVCQHYDVQTVANNLARIYESLSRRHVNINN